MRRLICVFLAIGALCVGSYADGGVISALSSYNGGDDSITDDSLGFIYDANGDGVVSGVNTQQQKPGDVAFGIAWIDDVNGDTTVQGRAYIVYSVEFLTVSSDGSATYKPTTVAGYKLDDILGVDINDNSVAAIVERTGTPAQSDPFFPKVDNTNNDYKFGNNTFPGVSAAQMIDDINGSDSDGLMAGASFLFAVGISASNDFFATGPLTWNAGIAKWQVGLTAGLSITDTGALNPADFKLLSSGLFQAAALSATQTLQGGSNSVPPPFVNGFIKTYDAGNYVLNYVPEPSSAITLAALGLVGLAWMARQRRKQRA